MSLSNSAPNACNIGFAKDKGVFDTICEESSSRFLLQESGKKGLGEKTIEKTSKRSSSPAVDRAYSIAKAKTCGSVWFVKTAGKDKKFKAVASHDKEVARRIARNKKTRPLTKMFWKWLEIALFWIIVLPFFAILPIFSLSVLGFVPQLPSWVLWTSGLLSAVQVIWIAMNLGLTNKPVSESFKSSNVGLKRNRVAIVGGGVSGLCALKEMIDAGQDAVLFERGDCIGGIWKIDSSEGRVSDFTVLTSSPYVTAFSSFPPPSELDSWTHWTHDQFQQYLEAFADHFSLWQYIRLNTSVNSIRPTEDCREPCGAQTFTPTSDSREKDGFWSIESTTHSKNKETKTEFFDHVAVCTGLNQYLRFPEIKGLDRFKGEVLHSSEVKDIQVFQNKKVVVVGFGESSVDLAAEAGKYGQKAYLSFRRGKLIIPRKNPLNKLANDFDTNRLRYSSPTWVRNLIMVVRRRICARTGHSDPSSIVRAYFLDSAGTGPNNLPATKSAGFVQEVLEENLVLKPMIRLVRENSVVFADGSIAEVDSIIISTGFKTAFPFIDLPGGIEKQSCGNLYLNMFYPDLGSKLAFIGYARPLIGAIPPTAEMQSRLYASVISGRTGLPEPRAMKMAISKSLKRKAVEFPTMCQPHILVNWIPYLDKLATLIGCKVSIYKIWNKPLLLWKVLTGPFCTYQYRLFGPGSDFKSASRVVASLPRMHQLTELTVMICLSYYSFVIALLTGNECLYNATTFL